MKLRDENRKLSRNKGPKKTYLGNEEEFNDRTRFGYRKLRSTASLIEYFGDDAHDEAKMLKMNNKYFYHEHTVNFSFIQYFEMLLIHLIAYVVLGPLINIYTLIFYKHGKWLMNNL
jgi:hypothetical protein